MADREKRVVIHADAQTHMMPALARKMARRGHGLVLGDAQDGLADELVVLGARAEGVPDTADQTRADTIQKLVDRAKELVAGVGRQIINGPEAIEYLDIPFPASQPVA